MTDTGFTYDVSERPHTKHFNALFLNGFMSFIREKTKAGTALALVITERL
jgi:hypothetical protein